MTKMSNSINLFDFENFKPRLYQELIAATAMKRNTLVVLPTGLGKTLIAGLVAAYRLQKYPKSKVLVLAPTRPLCAQHQKAFRKMLKIPSESVVLVTGRIKPEKRKQLYSVGKVIVSTPQCIKNDLERGILDLKDFSLVVFDEAHRCVKDYAYTHIAKEYVKQSLYPLILGLTASPGGDVDRVKEIMRNLSIEAVEVRTEDDPDVKPYVQKTYVDWVYVSFPEEFKRIQALLKEASNSRLELLRNLGLDVPKKPTLKELLQLNSRIANYYERTKDRSYGMALSLLAEIIKIEHAIELLETQGIKPLHAYFCSLEKQTSKATKKVLNDPRVRDAKILVERLYEQGYRHPKMDKLVSVIKRILAKDPDARIIVFANYRSTVNEILKRLEEEGIKARKLVGQAKKEVDKGLKQEEQITVLNEFRYGFFNVLVASSVGEEGLDIPEVSAVIFYEPVPSELRRVQRRGRTGRTMPGKVIFLLTKGTRDEAYYWASWHREKKMKKLMYALKKEFQPKSKSLTDYLKGG